MTQDGDTSEAAFFTRYTMTWIAIIISRLCVILARWQVFTHAQELVSSQGQRYLPRHSISDTKCKWHATIRLYNSRGCLLWSLQQIPLKAGDWSTISSDSPSNLEQITYPFSSSGSVTSLRALQTLMNVTRHWRCLGGKCYCTITLVERFAFSCRGCMGPPEFSCVWAAYCLSVLLGLF